MSRVFPCAALLLLVSVFPARAQQEDVQAWEQLNVVVPLVPRVRLTVEQIARTGDRLGGLYTTEYGGILGWQMREGVELGMGYRRVGFHNRNLAPDEDRLRQHLVVTSGRFAGRFRVDERFVTHARGVGVRIRPLLRYNLPIGRDRLALFASHESIVLVNTTRWGQRAGYERMRNILGVAVPLGRALSADIGYLNQYRLARNGARPQMDHALSVQLTVNLGALGVAVLQD
ncbi:DUF2490 domain-containing protein [Sphingomonas sp. ABOLD]|uniref:DUF2490 domain-containing protein n=1 Tax=Sphingomonas trueperi TaxID=53317 RepID=A0A7X5XWJ0_9SPHN|nr:MULTISPECIES: DUF2490 domain-containing protein [Sphingomonas]NJB96402.1 hypothetical protein [Sphingomonas trueperi]RSV37366.1 DUF2490 domain-containing protein [Sphingomonas sp. ABOLD]RSV39865.1 DUF2490 domain-containing protein [Sphingomonas sp. ABOLE]